MPINLTPFNFHEFRTSSYQNLAYFSGLSLQVMTTQTLVIFGYTNKMAITLPVINVDTFSLDFLNAYYIILFLMMYDTL